jgi:cryptochrome
LARLAEQLSDKGWVAAFEKPKGDPAAIDPKPATTVLSPYLKFGCISARLFYQSLIQVCPIGIGPCDSPFMSARHLTGASASIVAADVRLTSHLG